MAEPPAGPSVRRGFVLVLLLCLAVLAVAGTVMLPNLLASDLCSHETGAIGTLRNLAACQVQFQAMGAVDTDGDGVGEFGTLRELTGSVPLRAAPGRMGKVLAPPVLSPVLAGVTTEGWVERSHYAYAVFLPRVGGGWIRETGTVSAGPAARTGGCSGSGNGTRAAAGVSAAGTADADLAERDWCAVAWPRMVDERTRRVFFVTARGEVLQAANRRGVFCGTVLPEGPGDVLPPDWKPGDPLPGMYTSRSGEAWKGTN